MQTEKYYVIKPTTHSRKKVTYGDGLVLTESQARPLRNGGFVSPDKAAAQRIAELAEENQTLKTEQNKEQNKENNKESDKKNDKQTQVNSEAK